jgi:hypothetical protein
LIGENLGTHRLGARSLGRGRILESMGSQPETARWKRY